MTGAGTVRTDDPQLTVRLTEAGESEFPAAARVPLRVVLDTHGTAVQAGCGLLRTLPLAPLLVCVGAGCAEAECERLRGLGVQVLRADGGAGGGVDIGQVLTELGRRGLTHVLLECGPGLMGSFWDAGLVDELHVFVAPKLVGGAAAVGPVGGLGLELIPGRGVLEDVSWRQLGEAVEVTVEVRVGVRVGVIVGVVDGTVAVRVGVMVRVTVTVRVVVLVGVDVDAVASTESGAPTPTAATVATTTMPITRGQARARDGLPRRAAPRGRRILGARAARAPRRASPACASMSI